MINNILLILLGFALLTKGADILVKGSHSIAKKFHISELIIGITVVSIGTSLPELVISSDAALKGHADLALSNILGSCICNILLVLGATAVVRKVHIDRQTRNIILPINVGAMILLMALGNMGLNISRFDGLILLIVFAIFIKILINISKLYPPTEEEKSNNKEMNSLRSIIYVLIGIIALKFGGDFVVNNATDIANYFNLSEKIIGLTIVSIGTSLPELVTGIVAAYEGDTQIALGNIIGSNIFNILMVTGISAIISPIEYLTSFNSIIIFSIISIIIIYIFNNIREKHMIGRTEGFILLLMYLQYIVYLFI